MSRLAATARSHAKLMSLACCGACRVGRRCVSLRRRTVAFPWRQASSRTESATLHIVALLSRSFEANLPGSQDFWSVTVYRDGCEEGLVSSCSPRIAAVAGQASNTQRHFRPRLTVRIASGVRDSVLTFRVSICHCSGGRLPGPVRFLLLPAEARTRCAQSSC